MKEYKEIEKNNKRNKKRAPLKEGDPTKINVS